jgi:competence protein ComGC
MKNGVGLLDLLFVLLIILLLVIPLYGMYSKNIINKDSQTRFIEQKKYVDNQVKIIEDAKARQIKRLEMLNQGN